MPKRRANGEGNIRKRKDGRWEGRYTVGHDPETGKAIIKNVLGKTQAAVKDKLKSAIEENVGIDYGKAKSFTVGSWLEVWMENYAKIKLRPSTFKTSLGFLKNHIKPQIGSIPLAGLTSLDLQKFYKHLLEGGRVDRVEAKQKPKGISPKTVRNIHQMISSEKPETAACMSCSMCRTLSGDMGPPVGDWNTHSLPPAFFFCVLSTSIASADSGRVR